MFFQNMDIDFGNTNPLFTNSTGNQTSGLVFEQANPFGTPNTGNTWDFANPTFGTGPQG